MKVAVTGITGMVGTRLAMLLLENNHEVVGLTRNKESAARKVAGPVEFIEWDGKSQLDGQVLDGVEAVVHLAGESIASSRWTSDKKKRLYDSRVKMTSLLVKAINSSKTVKIFVGASAVGFYGDRSDELLDEQSTAGTGFLSDICRDWENAYTGLSNTIRKAIFRIGVVLGPQGGMLEKLIPIFQKYVGGKVGDGTQWTSWIHIEDLCQSFLHALEDQKIQGTYNATAPNPVANETFSSILAKALGRPCLFPVPKIALKTAFGEMSQLMLGSTRAIPKRLEQEGFSFSFATLDDALSQVCEPFRGGTSLLIQEQWLDAPKAEVFGFFSDPHNLEKITPPWLNFKILKMDTAQIQKNSLIDYKLNLHGLPMRWRTQIHKWQPIDCFVDKQLKGPYKVWHHTHLFKTLKGGTLIRDVVRYKLPLGVLGDVAAGWYVRSDVQKIFSYRFKSIRKYFK